MCVGLGLVPLSAQSDTTSSGSITPDNSAPGSADANQRATDDLTRTPRSSNSSDAMRSDSSSRPTTDDSSLKRGDRRFITKAAESNQKEIALAQLAAERATRPEVRSYAQQLATEHQQLGQELAKLAQDKGVTIETAMNSNTTSASQYSDTSRTTSGNGIAGSPSSATAADMNSPRASGDTATGATGSMHLHAHMDVAASGESDRHYRSLSKKSGADFDKAFVDLMADEHKSDVKLFERASKSADDDAVRSFASQHLPSLQAHLDHANNLMKSAAE